jgi:predicted membrane-bound spermidine synthase
MRGAAERHGRASGLDLAMSVVRPVFHPAIGMLLALLSGAVALSYELIWYRAYSIALMGRPQAFGVVLGGYLAGLAAGAWLAAYWCRRPANAETLQGRLAGSLTMASACGFLLIPAFARLVTVSRSWGTALALVAVAAVFLGVVFPLIVQATAPGLRGRGRVTALIYASNIAGAVAGSVVTGFVFMDMLTLATLSTGLALMGLLQAAIVILLPLGPRQRPRRGALARATAVAGIGVGLLLAGPSLYAGTMERLFFRTAIATAPTFVRTVENRSGIIGVTAGGELYGGGVYDGVYNTDLKARHRNQIQRAFAVTALHPAPRHVLMIGLGTGSWAKVLADDPLVETVTVVEINPGYVELLGNEPAVADLTRHPKVRIEIDDGRRWLLRHPGQRFDVIVANTVYHWRANATSLLSVEFLEHVRRHLLPGGVYYFNSTSEGRVQRTGALTFPYAWRFAHLMAVSDAPIVLDLQRWRNRLFDRGDGAAPLDATKPEDVSFADELVEQMRRELEPRDELLARTADLQLITDDNMGTEWALPERYRVF